MKEASNRSNDFLLEYLQRLRRMCHGNNKDRLALIYSHAAQSVAKYPLPIICESQLRLLAGIGDHLRQQLIRLIRTHYAAFISKDNAMSQPEQSEILSIQKPLKSLKLKPNTLPADYLIAVKTLSQKESSFVADSCTNQLKKSQNKDNLTNQSQRTQNNVESQSTSLGWRTEQQREQEESCREFSCKELSYQQEYSCKVQIGYKGEYSCKARSVRKSEIKRSLKQVRSLKQLNMLKVHENRLLKQGLIAEIEEEVSLTKKGREALEIALREDSQRQKLMLSVRELQSRVRVREEPKIQNVLREQCQVGGVLRMLVDVREMKGRDESGFIIEKLREKHSVECTTVVLPIGDFAWEVNGKVLQFLIERKTADDLLSSLTDGRYKEQKVRMEQSGAMYRYYLVEGHLSQGGEQAQKQIRGALLKTMIRDGFRVVCTKDINQSLRFLAFLHKEIQHMRQKGDPVFTLGSIAEFNAVNSKKKQLTVGHAFALSLKSLNGVGSSTVAHFLKYFGTFKSLYEELSKLEHRRDKIAFLRELFRGSGIKVTLPNTIVDFFFGYIEE